MPPYACSNRARREGWGLLGIAILRFSLSPDTEDIVTYSGLSGHFARGLAPGFLGDFVGELDPHAAVQCVAVLPIFRRRPVAFSRVAREAAGRHVVDTVRRARARQRDHVIFAPRPTAAVRAAIMEGFEFRRPLVRRMRPDEARRGE